MTDVETVTVTVKIPAQEYTFVYEKYWWDIHKEGNLLDHFMNVDLSSLDPDIFVYGPDGVLVMSIS